MTASSMDRPSRPRPEGRPLPARRRLTSGAALRRFGLVLALVLAAAPASVQANDRVEARRHFQAGMALVQAGKYQEGIQELEKAYEALPHPSVLFNIGRAWVEAGDDEQAIRYLERYVATEPPDADQVRDFIENLRQRRLEAARRAGRSEIERQERPAVTEPAPATEPARTAPDTPPAAGAAANARPEDLAQLVRQLAALSARMSTLVGEQPPGALEAPGPGEPAGTGPETAGTPGVAPEVSPAAPDPYAPVVITSSRYRQSPLEAPNALTVLTGDDIRRSGARTLPDVLRRIPGLDVMALSPGDHNLGLRGFNSTLANKVLVLVDGRSVYLDFVGATLWPLLSISLSDIERIEVIRGPGAALYGANAFSGVVNIITRAPAAPGDRPQLSLRGGVPDWIESDLHLAGRSGATAWRASAGLEQADRWTLEVASDRPDYELLAPSPTRAVRVQRLDARVDHRLSRDASLSVSGGMASGQVEFAAIGALRDFFVDGSYSFLRGDLLLPAGLSMRAFWNRFDAVAAPWSQPVGSLSLASHPVTDVVDLEAEWYREARLVVDHRVNLGLGYRYKTADWEWLGADPREHHLSFFFQDELRPTPSLIGVVSLRVDRHPVLADRAAAPFLERYPISPRGALIWRFTPEQSVRATVGTAFRTPTFLENYISQPIPTGNDAVAVLNVGNPDLAPERILSAEVGYLNQPVHSRYEIEGAAYFNRISGLVRLSDVQPWEDPSTIFDPTGGFWYAGTTEYVNEDEVFYALGVELGGRWYFTDGVSLYANYAFTRIEGENGQDRSAPSHKLNAGVRLESRQGLSANIDLNTVSSQTWVLRSFDDQGEVVFTEAPVLAYTRLDVRLAWHSKGERIEAAIEGQNLLAPLRAETPASGGAVFTPEGAHREYPLGQSIPAGVSAELVFRF